MHERLDAVLSSRLPGRRLPRRLADHWNRRLVAAFDTVVRTTHWARDEFDRIDAQRIVTVPLGDMTLPSGAGRPHLACMFGWQRTIDRMLDIHDLPVLQRA
ncbi:MAG TPA: hypothetical protein VFZ70_12960 [Euzebyales bacterium]